MNNRQDKNIFTRQPFVSLLATLTALTWAFAFPLIKIGFSEFAVSSTDTGAKTLFAGIRFFLAGIFTLIIAKVSSEKFSLPTKQHILLLLLFSLVNTSLHYFFFYIGLSYLSGSRSAIIDSSGTFFLIILACIVFKNEKMTSKKILGCILGFSGILIINIDFHSAIPDEAFSLSGDGMLLLSALCSAFGGILTRIITRKIPPLIATGFSLGIGGLVMIIFGIAMGGRLTKITTFGCIILLLLVSVSAVGFSLYNKLISCNPVGKIAIFNALIPVFGAVLSCIILNEPFQLKYILSAFLVFAGIYVI
ncbi:MAG: DMT family transporter [Clostridia bacterium]|nr:DMT family transporter [Clostridia bacterium]